MAHEITDRDKMFSVREMPWHYSETKNRVVIFGDYPGREQAAAAAGHDFTVAAKPLLVPVAAMTDDDVYAQGQRLDGWQAVVREDNGRTLGVTRQTYACIQPTVLYDIAEAVLEASDGEAKYTTGGTLRGAAVMWLMATLGREWQVPGDDTINIPYLCISSSHDGSQPLAVDATDVRVVCGNTFGFMKSAVAGGRGRSYTFRHTAKWQDRVQAARDALLGIRAQHDAYIETLYELGTRRLNPDGVQEFLVRFFPAPPKELMSDRVMANIEDARNSVRTLLAGATGTVPAAHVNTAYGLFLAGTEYLDHVRANKSGPEGKFNRSVLNHDKAKDRVVKLVREVSYAS